MALSQRERSGRARQIAIARWKSTAAESRCWVCGLPLGRWLEVAHLSGDRSDDGPDNLAILCPTCHRMHDVGIIDSKAVVDGRELLLKGNDPDVVAVHRDFVANISKGDWALLFGDAQK